MRPPTFADGVLVRGIDTRAVGWVGSGHATSTLSGNSACTNGLGYAAARTRKAGKAIALDVPGD